MAKKKPAAKKVAKKATGKHPVTFSVPVAKVAAKRRQLEAIASGKPVLGWTRWCPQTFSDGKGMGAAGAPVSSLAAINPSPADCEIVACEMQQAEKARQAAADELTKWSNAGATFFKDARKRFGSELQVALEAAIMDAASPDFFSGDMSHAQAKKLYATIVAAGTAGFEFALKRYAGALRDVPELKDAIAKTAEARRTGAKKSIEQQQERSLKRAAQARELYAAGTMTYAQIAEHFRTNEGMPTCNADTVRRWVNGKK